jgi:hypothetical protein
VKRRARSRQAPFRAGARSHRAALLAVLPLALSAGGCGLLFDDEGPPGPPGANATPVGDPTERPSDVVRPADDTAGLPAGEGTLRHNEISVYLRRGELQLRVTPLAESVIRVAAPDTYERLSALGQGYQRMFLERTGAAVPFQLFLVAVHAEATAATYEPEDLTLVSRGLRYRPAEIRPVTPAWTRNRVEPQETLMAVYAFPPEVDLDGPLEVEYREVRDRSWERILPRIQAERARIGAR